MKKENKPKLRKRDSVLNLQQESFCKFYTTRGVTGGNCTISYSFAYDIEIPMRDGKYDTGSKEYAVCQAAGSRLLNTERVQARIKEMYLEVLDEKEIDKRLSEIIHTGEDKDSIQGIKIFNDLKQRITKKVDVTTQGRPLAGLSDEELKALLEQ